MWATLNEPWVVTDGGYLHGGLAPGHRNLFEAPIVTHNLMRAHGAAVDAYRAEGKHAIGLVVNLEPKYPASDSEADLAATRRADAYMNRQFLDTALLGRYPEELPGDLRRGLAASFRTPTSTRSGGRSTSSGSTTTRAASCGTTRRPGRSRRAASASPASTRRWSGRSIPTASRTSSLGVRERYGAMPLYVTENGAAFEDPAPSNGVVADPARAAYLRDHLRAARRALEAGVDLRGYFAWSLLDNFEWSYGTSKRFGLVRVDYDTQRRTPKDERALLRRASSGRAARRSRPRSAG